MRLVIAFVLSFTFADWLIAQQLAALPKLDPVIFDAYLGRYDVENGPTLVVARSERRLFVYEPSSGRMRGLERVSDATWTAGPSLLVYAPESYRLEFVKDSRGDITSLRYAVPGSKPASARRQRFYREEPVLFRNGPVALSGTLLLPSSKGPHPAIVLAHGSGSQDRNGYLGSIRFLADHLASRGIAVLIYDKRGSGRSTGDWATASFTDLAADLITGIRFLRSRDDIVVSQVGAGGSSQAGWVIAKAVTQLPDIPFVVVISAGGSGYTVEQQNLYNTAVEMRAAHVSAEGIALTLELQRRFFDVLRRGQGADATEYDAAVAHAANDTLLLGWLMPRASEIDWRNRNAWYTALEVGFDPLPAWRAYRGSVLAVFGELDAETPVVDVVPRMTEALLNRAGTDFTISVFAKASHLLLEATRASDDELASRQYVVSGFYDLISDWLHGRIRRQQKPERRAAPFSGK